MRTIKWQAICSKNAMEALREKKNGEKKKKKKKTSSSKDNRRLQSRICHRHHVNHCFISSSITIRSSICFESDKKQIQLLHTNESYNSDKFAYYKCIRRFYLYDFCKPRVVRSSLRFIVQNFLHFVSDSVSCRLIKMNPTHILCVRDPVLNCHSWASFILLQLSFSSKSFQVLHSRYYPIYV